MENWLKEVGEQICKTRNFSTVKLFGHEEFTPIKENRILSESAQVQIRDLSGDKKVSRMTNHEVVKYRDIQYC